jgi:hypothetical protein
LIAILFGRYQIRSFTMYQQTGNGACRARRRRSRLGGTIVYVAVSASVLFGFVALSIDVGRVYVAKVELQRAADAAAHAGAWVLLDEDRLKDGLQDGVFEAARLEAVSKAARNEVLRAAPIVHPYEDVTLGRWDFLNHEQDTWGGDPGLWNAVSVNVQRNAARGGSIIYYFARLLGFEQKDLAVSATAAFEDGIDGFEVTDQTGNAPVLPYSLRNNCWHDMTNSPSDNYTYDPDTGEVFVGGDGIPELNIFPGGGDGQLPPGNFGTVDIGGDDNSASDLVRQILTGISAEDLAYHGGSLEFGPEGYLDLNGDTGISAGTKDALETIKGKPRAIPLFSDVWDPGNNATFRVMGWAGVRIMHVRLIGAENRRQLIVQPAFVVHDSSVGGGTGPNYFVFRPAQLVE